ncbi:MAG: SpoIIIAH-like family protein [Acutalibacteraceae bacterium]
MKIKKQHIVMTAMVLALGSAVMLNWQFGDDSLVSSKELGKVEYVSKEATVETKSNLTTEQENYFAEVRTERQQAEDKILDIAKDILKQTDNTDKAKASAVKQVNSLEKTIKIQNNIESLLKAKGFSECICFISDDGCDIVVPKGEVGENATIIIKDMVKEQSKIDYDKITIVQI